MVVSYEFFVLFSLIFFFVGFVYGKWITPKVVIKYIKPQEKRSHGEIMSYLSDDGRDWLLQGVWVSFLLWLLFEAERITKEYEKGVPVFSLKEKQN